MQIIPINAMKACAALTLLALASTALTAPAYARQRHAQPRVPQAVEAANVGTSSDERYAGVSQMQSAPARNTRSRAAASSPYNAYASANYASAGFGSSLVNEARRYLGGNPTGRSSLWCGAFMDMILKRTGHEGGGNLARNYASYGHRISGPQVGAIAVMGRKGGGHVGVVSGIDPSGNPIIVSGNHGHRVAESTYPRGRIYAYVMP